MTTTTPCIHRLELVKLSDGSCYLECMACTMTWDLDADDDGNLRLGKGCRIFNFDGDTEDAEPGTTRP